MKFKANPLLTFVQGEDPISIHCRTRWLNDDKANNVLAPELIRNIINSQSENGSWNNSIPNTIEQLFALSLLLKQSNDSITRAIEWLMEVDHAPMKYDCNDGATYDNLFFRTRKGESTELRKMSNVPFTGGCSGFVKTGATLYFATHFNAGPKDRTQAAFETFNQVAKVRSGRWCTGSCANNVLQAFAHHPRYSKSDGMGYVIDYMAQLQEDNGSWSQGIPFYPTLKAFSHLDTKSSNKQFERALQKVTKAQSNSGSWGKSHRLLNTYLVIDALERKGITTNIL